MKKNSCTPINPKKYSCKEFDNKKKIPADQKFPLKSQMAGLNERNGLTK